MRKRLTAIRTEHQKVRNYIQSQAPELAQQISSLNYSWFTLKNSAKDDDATDLYIYDEIMPAYLAEWIGGVSAEGMIAQLNEITTSTINVRINSPGGAVFEAIAIYNALINHSATVNVFVDSLAASAASVIAMAGDKVTMMIGSQLMIHDAMGIEMGNAAELREYAEFLDKQSNNIASIYAEKTGGDAADFRALMLKETWLFAEEAVELGLADEVYTRPSSQDDPEEDEDPEETEDEEEKDPEEDPPPDEDEDEAIENRMNRRHSLANRGFTYAGRRKAPEPSTSDVDSLIDVFANFFGGK